MERRRGFLRGTWRQLSLVAALLSLFVLAACEGDHPKHTTPPSAETPTKRGLGANCRVPDDCLSGICEIPWMTADRICTQPCESAADCPASEDYPRELVCGAVGGGRRGCIRECTRDFQGLACIDGVATDCADLKGSHCRLCGCPAGEMCGVSDSCQVVKPKSELGGPCQHDGECLSGNCSTFANVCRVPVGQPCTRDNCDLCKTAQGFSFCSRECYLEDQCGSGLCLGSNRFFVCEPPCTSSCPGSCGFASDGSQFCKCEGCTVVSAPRKLGNACSSNWECESQLCNVVAGIGYCSTACAGPAGCVEGYSCLPTPGRALDSTATSCVPHCGAGGSCPYGECRTQAGAQVCDIVGGPGARCSAGTECLSGRCVLDACIEAGGAGLGARCAVHADCASQTCVNGGCASAPVLGNPCTSSAQCAAGICCPATMTCRTSC